MLYALFDAQNGYHLQNFDKHKYVKSLITKNNGPVVSCYSRTRYNELAIQSKHHCVNK